MMRVDLWGHFPLSTGKCPRRWQKRTQTLCVILMLVLAASSFGCGPAFRKKFIRKKKPKEAAPPQPILKTRDYGEAQSNEWWYRLHYSYWWTWHKELIEHLGQNHKRDILSSRGVMEELGKMKERLKDEKAAALKGHIDTLKVVTDGIIAKKSEGQALERLRRRLEKEMRAIRKGFDYPSVKGEIKENI